MLTPDKELALGILDALDDRRVSRLSPTRCDQPRVGRRAWVAQRCEMIDGIYAWLERQKRQARHDLPLQQAITTLCDRLAVARDVLLQGSADLDPAVEPAWGASQRSREPTPETHVPGARKSKP